MTHSPLYASSFIPSPASEYVESATHFELCPVQYNNMSMTTTDIVGDETTHYLIRMGRPNAPSRVIAVYDDLADACAYIFSLEPLPKWYDGRELWTQVHDTVDLVMKIAIQQEYTLDDESTLVEIYQAACLDRSEIGHLRRMIELTELKTNPVDIFPGARWFDEGDVKEILFASWFELRSVSDGEWTSTTDIVGRYTNRYQIRMGLRDGLSRMVATYNDLVSCQKDFFKLKSFRCPLYYIGVEKTFKTTNIVEMLLHIITASDTGTPEQSYVDDIVAAAGLSKAQSRRLERELQATAARERQ